MRSIQKGTSKLHVWRFFFGSSIGHLLNKLVIKRLLILESSHHILVFPGLFDIDIDIKIAQLKMRHFGDLFKNRYRFEFIELFLPIIK